MCEYESERPLESPEQKRQSFEESGRFLLKKATAIGVVAFVVLFAGFTAYRQFFTAPEVGGATVASPVTYASGQVRMVKLNSVPRGSQGIVLPLADVGGCMAYPPQEIAAEVQGDEVHIRTAPLEAWAPRGFGETN